MEQDAEPLSIAEVFAARQRRLDMQHLQAIEGNPLDAEQLAMLERMDEERWSHDRALAHVLERAQKAALSHAAE